MLPPRTWSFPSPPPNSFCKRIWEHPHDGEKFTFTLDEMTTGPDAQYQGIHINLFYLLNALSYRWEENNAGSAWRGAYIASISNINTTKFDCERCAMDGARCYRGSKGQSIQSNKCARCMVIYVPCDLSIAKIEPACPRGVTINTGERLHVVTKSLDRVKKEHPGLLDGWKGGADLVAHINPSGDYYANLAPTDPTSLQWLRNILEYLPHCQFDEGTQRYTATLDSTINMLPFAISKGKQENVRRGGTPSIDLVDNGCHLRENMESSEAEAGTSEKASTRPATQRETTAIEKSPMETQTPEKEEFGSARREAGPARRIRIEDRKDRSGTAASTTLARANDQSGASSPNKTPSASRDSKFLVDAVGFRIGATSSQRRIIRSTATSGEASRKAPSVFGGEVLSDSEVESRPKTRKRQRRSDSEGESEGERGGEHSSRKKLENPQRTLTLHMIDSMPQHSMWYRKRLMVLEGIIDSHTEGEGGELTGLKTEIYQWYASTINGPIRSNIQ